MGYSTALLFVCVCALYMAESRTVGQDRRLVARGARKPRANYVSGGYLFGKRSQMASDNDLNTVSRQYMTVEEVADLLVKDPDFALLVARTLDSNDDGFVQLTDLM